MNKSPSKWLKYCINNLSCNKGNALDLACGKGRNSNYLAGKGYTVISVDNNPENLGYISGPNITKIEKDVEIKANWPLTKHKFDLIVVSNFLCRKIFPNIMNSISKKGYLIYDTFSAGHEKIGRPKNKKFILKSKELLKLCKSMSLIFYEEVSVICLEKKYIKQRIFCKNV